MRRIAIVLALLAIPCLAQADESKGVFERDAVEVEAPAGIEISGVSINNRLGDVSVRGHDRNSIAIQSFKRAADVQTLERLVVSLIPDGQGQVSITTSFRTGGEGLPVAAGSIAIDLVVFVPRAAAVNAQVWNGQLQIARVDNGAELIVNKGSVDVSQVSGSVRSEVRKGRQAFVELFGELHARGLDGDLTLNTVQGKRLAISLVKGSIHGEKIKVMNMQIAAVFGDVDLVAELVSGGRYDVASRRGDVELLFYGEASVDMSVRAKKALLGPELRANGEEGQWYGYYGVREEVVRPSHLRLSAPTGTVLVKHF